MQIELNTTDAPPSMQEKKQAMREQYELSLKNKSVTDEMLIEAAMKSCDFHGDNQFQRDEMKKQCLEVEQCHRFDLLCYFNETYSKT